VKNIDIHHAISVTERGDLALHRFAWREINGQREKVPEVLAIYQSELFLVRDFMTDRIGLSLMQEEIKTVEQLQAETSRLIPICASLIEALAPERREKSAQYIAKSRQGAAA